MSQGQTAARLFHFTCDHGRAGIGVRGEIVPLIEHPILHCKVSWFTTLGRPDRESTGLSMHYTACDRMAYRYIITETENCRPWIGSPERDAAKHQDIIDLELYGDPEHWYIADVPVKARLG